MAAPVGSVARKSSTQAGVPTGAPYPAATGQPFPRPRPQPVGAPITKAVTVKRSTDIRCPPVEAHQAANGGGRRLRPLHDIADGHVGAFGIGRDADHPIVLGVAEITVREAEGGLASVEVPGRMPAGVEAGLPCLSVLGGAER